MWFGAGPEINLCEVSSSEGVAGVARFSCTLKMLVILLSESQEKVGKFIISQWRS